MKRAADERLKRYHEARALMKRMRDAWYRDEFEDGEVFQDVMHKADEWLEFEQLEDELFSVDSVDV